MIGERSAADHAKANDPRWRAVAGAIRRMVVTLAERGRWQLRGFRQLGELAADVEVFQGIGLWARPPSPASPAAATVEAIVLNLGDSDAPVVVALRDEKTRKAVAAAIAADTTILHNSKVGAYLTPDELIELRSHGGVAGALSKLADLESLRTAVAGIPVNGNPTIEAVLVILRAVFANWTPAGTTKVRGE